MKTRNLVLSIILSILLSEVLAQTENIMLNFNGKDYQTGQYIPLTNVYVQNLTKGCDTTIYGETPILFLEWSSGIEDYILNYYESFVLEPNFPNPFSGITRFKINMNKPDYLKIILHDVYGAQISELECTLQAGIHIFETNTGTNSISFVSVTNGFVTKSIKLIGVTSGDGNPAFIRFLNSETGKRKKQIKATNGFVFQPGDELKMKGSAAGYYDNMLYDNPEQSTSYTFVMQAETIITLPSVSTTSVSDITQNSATSGGEVTDDGGAAVIARGVCWSTEQYPTINDSHTMDGTGTGNFTSEIAGLEPQTTYYLRAYASNSSGTGYGNEINFETSPVAVPCPGIPTIIYEGQVYNTILIGAQCWLKENLNIGIMIDGIQDQVNNNIIEKYCYDNDPSNCDVYGGLYQWDEMMQYDTSQGSKGICPEGWHLPTDEEWKTLEGTVDSQYPVGDPIWDQLSHNNGFDAGGHLKEQGIDHWTNENIGATNQSGFTALPGGTRAHNGSSFKDINDDGSFWSSTSSGSGIALTHRLYHHSQTIHREYLVLSIGLSVRCLKDGGFSAAPTTVTGSVYNITTNSAQAQGEITDLGGAEVTHHGHCWSTVPNPTIDDLYYDLGSCSSPYIFTGALQGLSNETTYYIRAYATNEIGTGYGQELSFTTGQNISVPVVTTAALSNITQNSAISGGNVTDDGGAMVTGRGVCWGLNQNPTLLDNFTMDGSGTGSYVSNLTGLSPNTTYHVRAYAINSVGTAYGNELNFTTGQVYQIPTVTTSTVSNITQNSATCGGNVTDDGGSPVTYRGVCWNTNPNPTTANSYTVDGSGTGSFVSNLTGLSSNTTYYVRAYAINGVGTAYGNELSFTTGQTITTPTVTTTAVTNITQNSAISGGNVIASGGASVTERGVCWSISQNPNISNNHTSNGTGTGSFTSELTGLTTGTTYYVRAYASNSAGTAYGNQVSFSTLSLPVVTTNPVTNITTNSATSGGNVISGGGTSVTVRGVCWSTSQNPTISGSHTSNGSGLGSFISELTNLNTSTTYYVRAYATNTVGTAYGNQLSFTTLQGGPVLTGPSLATGPFELTWTYNWPPISAWDDHYELEYSYSPNSGFQILASTPNGDRTSPYTIIIIPEGIDIGKIIYFRVRAKVNGYYTPYSNVHSVNIPWLDIEVNPAADNMIMKVSEDPSYENTVFNNDGLFVGIDYVYTLMGAFYWACISSIYFDIDNFIANRTIQSAVLKLYVYLLAADYNTTYNINPIADIWNTNTLTWNNAPNMLTSPSIEQNPPMNTVVPWEVDITTIVQAWANGTFPNFGIYVKDNSFLFPGVTTLRTTQFFCSETATSPDLKPTLHLKIE